MRTLIEIRGIDGDTILLNPDEVSSIVPGYYSNRPATITMRNGRRFETYDHPDSIRKAIEAAVKEDRDGER